MDTLPLPHIQPSLDGATWVDKGFYSILIDTVVLCTEAGRSSDRRLERSLTRAVVLNSGVLVECAANVLVWGFFSTRTAEDIDKLSPLSKIDIYLECKGKARIDRGATVGARAHHQASPTRAPSPRRTNRSRTLSYTRLYTYV